MVCPYCSQPTEVRNSRHQKLSNAVWRRRGCTGCSAVFSTTEVINLEQSFVYQDPTSHHTVAFNRDLLFSSILASCGHRTSAVEDATHLTGTILTKCLTAQAKPGVITRGTVIESALVVLRNFDTAAATHYAAYHPLSAT